MLLRRLTVEQAHGKGDAAARRRIKALKRTFPEVSEDWASQVLLACNGDLAQAKQVRSGASRQCGVPALLV